MPNLLVDANGNLAPLSMMCLVQVQRQARAQLVAEHEQRAAMAAAEHAAALQELQQQAAEQQLAREAAQAAWAAAQSSLEQAVSDAAAQLEAAQQQSQVRPGACFVVDGWQQFSLSGSNNLNELRSGKAHNQVGRVSSSGAQETLGRLAAEHADALSIAYDELGAQLAAAQGPAEKAAAAAADQLQSLQEEAAAEQQALSARVAALEHEQAGRWNV